jgi:alanine racemase
LFTHYSSAEDDSEFTAGQRRLFEKATEAITCAGHRIGWLHASNSSGLLLEPDHGGNTIRAGLLVYGVLPHGKRPLNMARCQGFRPALSWKCRVCIVRSVETGTPVSYGHTFVTTQPARLATITVGYGDGLPRAASNRASVLIGGQRCPVVGRVTMDQTVVDVSKLGHVEAGDEVVLIGDQHGQQITSNELAAWCDTIPWEVLTNITYRVPRVYRGGHAA